MVHFFGGNFAAKFFPPISPLNQIFQNVFFAILTFFSDLKQVNITVNTMADELKNEKSISDAGDVCKALDNQSQQHFSQLAQMRGYDEQIVEIMNSFRQRQVKMAQIECNIVYVF